MSTDKKHSKLAENSGPALMDIMPHNETVEEEEIKQGGKFKVHYLIQKRDLPVRKEALSMVEMLKARAAKNPQFVKYNTNGQNKTVNTKGIVFDEGNREENVQSAFARDKDQAQIEMINRANIQNQVNTTATSLQTVKTGANKYDFPEEEQYFIRIQGLILHHST